MKPFSLSAANLLLFLLALGAAAGTFPLFPRALYSAPAFLLLLSYFFLGTLFRAAQKTFSLLRGPAEAGAPFFEKNKFREIPLGRDLSLKPELIHFVRRRRGRVTLVRKEEREAVFVSKNGWGEWGSVLIHLGFALLLLGGLATFLFARVEEVSVPEGEAVSLPGEAARIRLEKFDVVLDPSRRVSSDYVSHLLIEERPGKLVRKELRVNHPLFVGKTKLFQMRYQTEILWADLMLYSGREPLERIRVKPGERKTLARLPLKVELGEVVPDFVMGPEGNAGSRSNYFENPAVRIRLYDSADSKTPAKEQWAFQDLLLHEEKPETDLRFAMERLKKRNVSGIRLSRDPGVPAAYAGFVLLVAGTFLASFLPPFYLYFEPLPGLQGERAFYRLWVSGRGAVGRSRQWFKDFQKETTESKEGNRA